LISDAVLADGIMMEKETTSSSPSVGWVFTGREVSAVARTAVGSFPGDDFGKLLGLASALVALGLLPKGWQRALSGATALYMLYKLM
jgi:hypothetical protein